MNSVNSMRNVALLLVAVAATSFAQSDSTSINGLITDPTGAPISNAKITARNQNTGATRDAATSSAGTYVIPSLPSGVYSVTIEVAGFKKFENKEQQDRCQPAGQH